MQPTTQSTKIICRVTTRPGPDGKERESASVWVLGVNPERYGEVHKEMNESSDGNLHPSWWGRLTTRRPGVGQDPTTHRAAMVEEARYWVGKTFGYVMPLDEDGEVTWEPLDPAQELPVEG